MNSVGDSADWAFGEHPLRDVGVANGDAVGAAAKEHREVREVEDAAAGVRQTRQNARALPSEDLLDQVGIEVVVARINGRVRREDTFTAHIIDVGFDD